MGRVKSPAGTLTANLLLSCTWGFQINFVQCPTCILTGQSRYSSETRDGMDQTAVETSIDDVSQRLNQAASAVTRLPG